MPIKSFRGQIADGAVDVISLHTNTGSTGYRIKKFQIITSNPSAGSDYASIVKIYKIPQTSADGVVDFSDNTLLAAGIVTNQTDANDTYSSEIIFDTDTFNQDIYVTHFEDTSNKSCNYQIELEQVKLSLDAVPPLCFI